MKLKNQTFAVIAEKKDSISHKWFNQFTSSGNKFAWWKENYYIYDKGISEHQEKNKPKNMPIYTESEFEALLKAEQENEAKEADKEIRHWIETGEFRKEVEQKNEPKNTVFGSENIAHKTVFNPNGFVKPFKGFTLTKSEAEKILRDKFKLPDYVEFKIVE